MNDYDKQATDFMKANAIRFTFKLGNGKAPYWVVDNEEHGHHYRVTLSKQGKRISFDFWDCIANRRNGVQTLRPYSVLACISGDVTCPETFADFCGEYGYDADSMRAYRTFKRCAAFGERLRAFFTESEIETLQTIN